MSSSLNMMQHRFIFPRVPGTRAYVIIGPGCGFYTPPFGVPTPLGRSHVLRIRVRFFLFYFRVLLLFRKKFSWNWSNATESPQSIKFLTFPLKRSEGEKEVGQFVGRCLPNRSLTWIQHQLQVILLYVMLIEYVFYRRAWGHRCLTRLSAVSIAFETNGSTLFRGLVVVRKCIPQWHDFTMMMGRPKRVRVGL